MELIALLWKIRFQNKNILKITANRLLKLKLEENTILPYKVHFTSVKKLKFRFSRLLGECDVIPSPSHRFPPTRYRALSLGPCSLRCLMSYPIPSSNSQSQPHTTPPSAPWNIRVIALLHFLDKLQEHYLPIVSNPIHDSSIHLFYFLMVQVVTPGEKVEGRIRVTYCPHHMRCKEPAMSLSYNSLISLAKVHPPGWQGREKQTLNILIYGITVAFQFGLFLDDLVSLG